MLAASRYLTKIRKQFFSSKHLDERERLAFTLAAYNMGPERVQNLRTQARRRGLDPNRWFFQVERVAAEEIGMGVVSYVSSVNKYYLAYERERVRLSPGCVRRRRRLKIIYKFDIDNAFFTVLISNYLAYSVPILSHT